MIYTEFKSKTIKHLEKYREVLSNNQGTYRGNPKRHILPKDEEEMNLIGETLRSEYKNAKFLILKYHSMFNHLTSSQALTLNLFYPLLNLKDKEVFLDQKGCIHGADFSDLEQILKTKLSNETKAKFEYTNKDKTNYDFFIQDGLREITFEVKYTEETICTKSSSKNDSKRWSNFYRDGMTTLLGDENFAKEIFFCQYQLWRNIVNVTRNDSNIVCFVFSKERSDLEAEVEMARKLVDPIFVSRIKTIHIEDLYKLGLTHHKEHYTEFYNKYLNI